MNIDKARYIDFLKSQLNKLNNMIDDAEDDDIGTISLICRRDETEKELAEIENSEEAPLAGPCIMRIQVDLGEEDG